MQESTPVVGLIFLLAVAGWVFDVRYIRAGGARATRSQRVFVWIAAGLCLLLTIGMGMAGVAAEAVGNATGAFAAVLFGLYEWRRYLYRRGHPLSRPKAPSENAPA